MTLHIVMLKN